MAAHLPVHLDWLVCGVWKNALAPSHAPQQIILFRLTPTQPSYTLIIAGWLLLLLLSSVGTDNTLLGAAMDSTVDGMPPSD